MPRSRPLPLAIDRLVRSALVFVLALAATPAAAGAPRPVSCGQTAAAEAVLRESCTGDVVMTGGRLDLAGYTLHGTVYCDGELCAITSSREGGAIVGFGQPATFGVVAGERGEEASGDVVVDGVTVRGFATGIAARNVVLTNARVTQNLWRGVQAAQTIEAVNVVVSRNGDDGLHAGIGGVAVDGSTVSSNGGSGIRALAGVVALESEIEHNGRDGIENYSKTALVVDSTVSANGRHGVRSDDSDCEPADGIELRASEVFANATGATCADDGCADLVACGAPAVDRESACGTTQRMGEPGTTWDVCASD